MRHVVDELFKNGVSNVLSYSLVVKKTSEFIPNYFGMIIDEHDRVFFQLDIFPNNRLRKMLPFGSLRTLREDDINREPNCLETGVASLDRLSFADLWYYMRTQHSNVYVYEINGRIVAYLHFKYQKSGKLFLDLIACDKAVQGLQIGSILMRWAETFARSSNCSAIELWAIEDRVAWYADRGYELVMGEEMYLGKGEKYQKMSRRILYNVKPVELMLPVD
jgi:GNAT superfamily N-acetyltransferase